MTIGSKARASVGAPSRRVAGAEAKGAARATTAQAAGAAVAQKPTVPQQRDASPAAPAAPIQQAYRDLMRGLVDTDRGAEAGRTYKRLKA